MYLNTLNMKICPNNSILIKIKILFCVEVNSAHLLMSICIKIVLIFPQCSILKTFLDIREIKKDKKISKIYKQLKKWNMIYHIMGSY